MIKHALIATTLLFTGNAGFCEFNTHATGANPQPSAASAEPAASTAEPGAAAPAFSLTDQAGKTVALSDLAGKIVVLEWVNPDCPFVKRHASAKTMYDTAKKYSDKGVVWLAVNTTKYMAGPDNQKWIDANALPYQILDDHTGAVGKLYGAKTTPHMFVIDGKGKIIYAGAIDDDPQGNKTEKVNYVAQAIDETLAGKAVSVPQTKPYGCSVKYAD